MRLISLFPTFKVLFEAEDRKLTFVPLSGHHADLRQNPHGENHNP